MTRRLVGAVASCLVLFAGLWLVLAPFALGAQPTGKDWTDQTLTNVWSGIGLAVVGLIAAVALVAGLVRHLAERGLVSPRPRRAAAPTPEPVETPPAQNGQAGSTGDLDKLLAPLVAALAHDLERDHERGENGVDLASLSHSRPANHNEPANHNQPGQERGGHPANSAPTPSDQHREMPR